MGYKYMTDKQIETGLRAIFLFPETIKEVEQWEIVYGNPDINFPVELMDSMFEKILSEIKKPQ